MMHSKTLIIIQHVPCMIITVTVTVNLDSLCQTCARVRGRQPRRRGGAGQTNRTWCSGQHTRRRRAGEEARRDHATGRKVGQREQSGWDRRRRAALGQPGQSGWDKRGQTTQGDGRPLVAYDGRHCHCSRYFQMTMSWTGFGSPGVLPYPTKSYGQ